VEHIIVLNVIHIKITLVFIRQIQNSINLGIKQGKDEYTERKWINMDDILKEIETIDKWHSTHRTKNLIKILEDAISSNSSWLTPVT
jgi:hypothetical protein